MYLTVPLSQLFLAIYCRCTGAPKSLDESIKDAQFTRAFEAEIGEGRFKSIDVALTSAGLTRDEALREIRGLQEDRNDVKESTLATTHSNYSSSDLLYKISNLEEVDFRWEIGWLAHTNSQNVRTDISQLTSDAFLNISSFSDDDLATAIAAKFTTTAKPLVKGDITSALESSNADDIYEALTFNGGPLYVRSPEDRTAEDEIYIRSLAVIASEKESSRSGALTKLKALVTSNRLNGGQTESAAATPLILERFNTKASANKQALDNMFNANSTSKFSAEELARLQEIDKMVLALKNTLSTATKFSLIFQLRALLTL